MFRKVSALLVRSLRSDARLARFHLLRLALGLVVLLVLLSTYQNMRWQAAPGREFYLALTICNLLAITLSGATFFAMAISEEREEQTLPLLKMADMGPLALLLGKWLPRMITAILLLSIQIPFTLLAITMGGVAWSQIVATNWMLFAYLILVGNLGLLVSVWNHNTGSAFAVTAVLLAMFLFGGPVLGELALAPRLRGWSWLLNPPSEFLSALNPFLRVQQVAVTYTGGGISFQVGMSLILGAAFFVAAWISFEYATSLEPSGKSLVGRLQDVWSGLWTRPPRPVAAVRPGESRASRARAVRTPGRRRVWAFPIVYKDFYQVAGGPVVILARMLGYALLCGGTWVLFLTRTGGTGATLEKIISQLGMITLFWSLWFLGIEAAVIAARIFRSEIKDRTWATLSLLPRTVPQIAYAKLAGAALGLVPAALFAVAGCVLGMPELVRELSRSRLADLFAAVFFTLQILAALHLATYFSIAFDFAAWPVAIAMGGFAMVLETATLVSCSLALLDLRGADGDMFIFVTGILISSVLLVVLHLLTLVRLSAARASEG